MKRINHQISFFEYNSLEELNTSDRDLLNRAKEAIDNAYAPYSGYRVGAAIELENGKIVTGSNQENVAFPSGLCAERVAVFAASSQYPGVIIKTIAITSKAEKFRVKVPVTPCGACRQVMAEYENNQKQKIRVLMAGDSGKVHLIEGTENLLPLMFKADQLKI